jgi:integrase
MSHRPAVPSYRKHKQSGQAVVTFRLPGGRKKDYLLGKYGSAESKAEYARLLGEFQAGHGSLPGTDGPLCDLTINELLVGYLRHCDSYYCRTDGSPTGQAEQVQYALRPVMERYGHTLARNFGPLGLKAVRAAMVESGLSRKVVNQRIGIVRQFFKWSVAEELVPGSVYEALRAVAGLQPGRTTAAEHKPVRPADTAQIEAALPFMPPPVVALVRLQRLSGARGGELIGMRTADIDRSGPVWVYRPPQHKNSWRTRTREIFFGPKAQEVLRSWLERSPDGPLFSPAAAEVKRNAPRAEGRRTPRWPSHNRNAAARRAKRRRRAIGEHYSTAAYRQAIERACEKAHPLPEHLQRVLVKLPRGGCRRETPAEWRVRLGVDGQAEVRRWRNAHTWTPHQLRHAAATAIRKEYGIERAQIILGHSSAFTTEIYAEADREQARAVVGAIG